ncbi:hypothetical protein Hanom_Chr14g01326571 [Helianthus anomalus]
MFHVKNKNLSYQMINTTNTRTIKVPAATITILFFPTVAHTKVITVSQNLKQELSLKSKKKTELEK